MAYDYWYVYTCAPSSETRGSSAIAGKDATPKKKPCGLVSVRATKELISENHKPQARKCDACGNRPRLNAGIVEKSPNYMVREMQYTTDPWGVRRQSFTETDVPDRTQRKRWALGQMNERNRARLIQSSNASEQSNDSLEHSSGLFEHGGDLIE